MLKIEKIDHVGIRVHEEKRAVTFYEQLGFEVKWRGTFDKGHPIIMQHPSGVVINILGPADQPQPHNILQDSQKKFAGLTHLALRVADLAEAESFVNQHNIKITERFKFGTLSAFFIRDPDGNVIEIDQYPGEQPNTREDTHKETHFHHHP